MNESLYHRTLDALPTAVIVVGQGELVLFCNQRFQRILGAPTGERVLCEGEPFARVNELLALSDESAGALSMSLASVLSGDCEGFHLEIELGDAKDGISCLAEGAMLDAEGGRLAVVELRDMSEQRRADRARLRKLRLLQGLLDAIPSPVFYKDEEGIYRGCNSAFEAYIGLSREEVVGSSVYDVAPKELADTYHEMDMALLREKGVQIYEAPVRFADGSHHDVMFHKAAVESENGEVVGLVGVMLDITPRKLMEAEILQREELLDEQNRQLSTPILALGDGILALPIVGSIDDRRAELIMSRVLDEVAARRARVVVLDLTGASEVDRAASANVAKFAQAIGLLGARCYLTGIGPEMAASLVSLGADLGGARTLRNIAEALTDLKNPRGN